MATIVDVAKLAKVSVSTASYALNGSNKVSEKTREKVLQAAAKLNYRANSFAQNLKKNKTDLIALMVNDIVGPFYSELVKGIQDVASILGYNVMIFCESTIGKGSGYSFLKERLVEGAVILTFGITDEQVIELRQDGFPLVLLDRVINESDISSILIDNEKGARLAVQHLIELNHRKIGYISGSEHSHDNLERFNGYAETLKQNGITIDKRFVLQGDFTEKSGYLLLKNFLTDEQELPTAFFAANDEMAIGAIKAIKEKGLKVPEDISIVGFDDIPISEYIQPNLTTVRRPTYELGSIAAHVLFNLINGKTKSSTVTLDVELIERASTKERDQVVTS